MGKYPPRPPGFGGLIKWNEADYLSNVWSSQTIISGTLSVRGVVAVPIERSAFKHKCERSSTLQTSATAKHAGAPFMFIWHLLGPDSLQHNGSNYYFSLCGEYACAPVALAVYSAWQNRFNHRCSHLKTCSWYWTKFGLPALSIWLSLNVIEILKMADVSRWNATF